MTQSSRTFRIFVSSTFSDLKAERNALQEEIFPRLRDLAWPMVAVSKLLTCLGCFRRDLCWLVSVYQPAQGKL